MIFSSHYQLTERKDYECILVQASLTLQGKPLRVQLQGPVNLYLKCQSSSFIIPLRNYIGSAMAANTMTPLAYKGNHTIYIYIDIPLYIICHTAPVCTVTFIPSNTMCSNSVCKYNWKVCSQCIEGKSMRVLYDPEWLSSLCGSSMIQSG